MEEKKVVAKSDYPVSVSALLELLNFTIEVKAQSAEECTCKYKAEISECQYDIVDAFASYATIQNVEIPLMQERYVGVGDTPERARHMCMKNYLNDFVEGFSSGALQFETIYRSIERAEAEAIAALMDAEEKSKI